MPRRWRRPPGCVARGQHSHDFAHIAITGRWTLRPPLRARCVWRGDGRPPGQHAHARGRHTCACRPGEPRAPRRFGRGPLDRRRRGHSVADARRAVARGGGLRAAAQRLLRSVDVLPPDRRFLARACRGPVGADRRRGGPVRARLARRARLSRAHRRHRRGLSPDNSPAFCRRRLSPDAGVGGGGRGGPEHRLSIDVGGGGRGKEGRERRRARAGRFRAQAVRDPASLRAGCRRLAAGRAQGLLCHLVLFAHAQLQGHAHLLPARRLLSRPARSHAARAPWAWSTRASPPTRFPRGSWPIPIA